MLVLDQKSFKCKNVKLSVKDNLNNKDLQRMFLERTIVFTFIHNNFFFYKSG